MNTLTKERMEEMEATKEAVKSLNVTAVADLLMKVQAENKKVLEDNIDLKRMVTTNNQEIAELRAQLNILRALGYQGNMGHGSTVHNAGE